MADPEKPMETQGVVHPGLYYDDAIAFFIAAGLRLGCNACNNESWNVVVNIDEDSVPKHPVMPLAGPDGGLYLGGQNFPFVATVCDRCGFVRLHSRSKIISWVKDGKPAIQTTP